MRGGRGLNAGRQDVELPHHVVETVGVLLYDLHRLQAFHAGALRDLVLALVNVVHQVAHIRDVAHVAHLVAQVGEPAEEDVEGEEGAHVAEVYVAVHGRAADVKAHVRRIKRDKGFLLSRKRVGNMERMVLHVGHAAK